MATRSPFKHRLPPTRPGRPTASVSVAQGAAWAADRIDPTPTDGPWGTYGDFLPPEDCFVFCLPSSGHHVGATTTSPFTSCSARFTTSDMLENDHIGEMQVRSFGHGSQLEIADRSQRGAFLMRWNRALVLPRRQRRSRVKGKRPDLKGHVRVPEVLIQAHSSALSAAFYDRDAFPAEYRGDAFVALHGSHSRPERTGYKVIRVRMKDGSPTGEYEDFMTGFLVDNDSAWGRTGWRSGHAGWRTAGERRCQRHDLPGHAEEIPMLEATVANQITVKPGSETG